MNYTLLYITFIDFGEVTSGSMVRPQCLYQSFKEIGLNVKLLCGSQNNDAREKRKRNVKEIEKWLDFNVPDICYIEPSTYPILLSEDWKLIKKIHGKGIPIGYFFRDAYYKLGQEFVKKPQSLIKYLKNMYLRYLYYRDERMIGRYVSIVYFPTMTMASYFPYKDKRALPPAGENKECQTEYGTTGIYVGGISKAYGIDLLLESYFQLNKDEKMYKLILVCRNEELDNIDSRYRTCHWLEIRHASGTELEPLYKKANFALLPRTDSKYNDLSMSVKLFEYITYNLPIVACECKEMKKIVEKYDLGEVVGFNPDSFCEGIRRLLVPERFECCVANVKKALLNENLWTHRAMQIHSELTGKIKGENYGI